MKGEPLSTIAHLLGGRSESQAIITSYGIDSRKIVPGSLFFALKGAKNDGHRFLKEVAEKGAVAAVVSSDFNREESNGLFLIRVDDVLSSLQQVAQDLLLKRKTRIIGVTGSVGKTTAKEFIATLLDGKFRIGKSLGNSNSQVGLPLSILNSDGKEELFVLEMGMSEPHEIEKLVKMAPPEVALITKVGIAHAHFFPSGLEGIKKAKGEILSHPKTKVGIVPVGMNFSEGSCCKLKFGRDKVADYVLEFSETGCRISERGVFSPYFRLPFSASHLQDNFLAAAAVARVFGLTWEEIGAKISELKTYQKRFERMERNGIIFINDSYNANPESMKAALLNLPAGKRKIAILGEMKELGRFSEISYLLIAELASTCVDQLFCFGKECQPMVDHFLQRKRPVEFFSDLKSMKSAMEEYVKPGDVVLIKGSNSNELWKLLE